MQALEMQFALKSRGYNQADVARMAEVSDAMVSRVVHGKDRCLAVETIIEGILGKNPWPEAHHRRPRKNGRTN